MKSLALVTLVGICYCFSNILTAEAGRLASMKVVERLKEIEPKHAEIKYRIIKFVYSAKYNLVQRTDQFYKQLFAATEDSLVSVIALEDEFVYQLDHQSASVDQSCLNFLKRIVENNMYVAGVGYTNCINDVEQRIDKELKRVQKLLEVDESEVFYQSLLDVFEGENIIAGPEAILAKLKNKADEIDAFASDYFSALFDIVAQFSSRLCDLRNGYQACFNVNESILKGTFVTSENQLTSICLGSIVK
uniref:Protein TsetseEP domain-containing protein n=1 Tax=Anopheles maculatus TaxID=74869 RepID=A0A182S6R9_9DIPT